MIGVTPAYFLSKYGNDFTPEDVLYEVPIIHKLGFDAFQLEITKREYLDHWDEENLLRLCKKCEDQKVLVSQLVAHFLIDDLSTIEGIKKGLDDKEIDHLFFIINHLPHCLQLTIPFGIFNPKEEMSRKDYEKVLDQLSHSLENLLDKGKQQHVFIALELQPGAIIQGVSGFLQMLALLKEHPFLTYNFDTGHAHSTKDIVELIPLRLGSRISGTHLCDNDQKENLSLTPGEGTIEWERLIRALKNNHYKGSYDLEIMCNMNDVAEKYTRGLSYIRKLVSDEFYFKEAKIIP